MNAPSPDFGPPDFDAPDLAARLAAWRSADAELGGFAAIVSQRARIIELESELDRMTERAQWWELETRRLQAELHQSEVEAGAAPPPPVTGPGHRFPRRSR